MTPELKTPEEREAARRVMQAKLAEVDRLVGELVSLAEENGITFDPMYNRGYGAYTPRSHSLYDDPVAASPHTYPNEYTGWQASDICY